MYLHEIVMKYLQIILIKNCNYNLTPYSTDNLKVQNSRFDKILQRI